jgi:hypothetical protein
MKVVQTIVLIAIVFVFVMVEYWSGHYKTLSVTKDDKKSELFMFLLLNALVQPLMLGYRMV